jgi:hypothetical protein
VNLGMFRSPQTPDKRVAHAAAAASDDGRGARHITAGARVVIEGCECGLGACGRHQTHNGEMGVVVNELRDSEAAYFIVDWRGTRYCRSRVVRLLYSFESAGMPSR